MTEVQNFLNIIRSFIFSVYVAPAGGGGDERRTDSSR